MRGNKADVRWRSRENVYATAVPPSHVDNERYERTREYVVVVLNAFDNARYAVTLLSG